MNYREILSQTQRQQQQGQYKSDRQQSQWKLANTVQNTVFAGVDPQTGQSLCHALSGGIIRGTSITNGAMPRNSWVAATMASQGRLGTFEGKLRG